MRTGGRRVTSSCTRWVWCSFRSLACRGPVYVHSISVAGQRWLAVTFTEVEIAASGGAGSGGAGFYVQLRAFERSRRLEVSYGGGVNGSGTGVLFPSPPRVRWGPFVLLDSGVHPMGATGVRLGDTLLIAADCTSDAECATGDEYDGDGAPLVCTSGASRERGVACTRTGVFPATEPVYAVAGQTLSAFLVSSCELAGVTHDVLFMVMDGERLALPLTEAPLLTPFGDILPGSFRFRADVPPPRLGARLTLAVHHAQPAEPGRILGGSNTTLLRVSVLLRRGSTASARRVAASPPSNATTVPGGACSLPESSRSHGRRLNGCCSSGYNHRSDRLG